MMAKRTNSAPSPLCPRNRRNASQEPQKAPIRGTRKTEGQRCPGGHTRGRLHGVATQQSAAGFAGKIGLDLLVNLADQESAAQASNRRVPSVSCVRGRCFGGAGVAG